MYFILFTDKGTLLIGLSRVIKGDNLDFLGLWELYFPEISCKVRSLQ